MGASSTEGTGHGSADDRLRGFDQSHIHKIFIGPLNSLKTCVDFINNKYILRILAEDVLFDDTSTSFSANTVQEAIEALDSGGGGGGDLQSAYDNSTPPRITLDPLLGQINIRDNTIPLGTDLFSITDNSGFINYLSVTDTSVNLSELRFQDSGFYLAFNAPTLTGNTTWTLPNSDGTLNQVLTTDGAGILSWQDSSSTLQDAYDNSSPNPEITLDSVAGPIIIKDNSIPLGTDLFQITNNAGSSNYLTVDANATSVPEIRFPDSGFYVGFTAPTLAASQIWTLPIADGTNGQFLRTNGLGVLSWGTASGGGGSNRFSIAFTSASSGSPVDYSAGILTVTHSLGEQFCGSVTVTDNNNDVIIPDNINMTSTTVMTISLISYHTIPGTWNVTILA